jgi:ubiquinone/menaquinone biosynthesis C-methylase UbiE
VRGRLRALLPRLHVLPPLSGGLDHELHGRVLDGAELSSGDTVADVGAGTGLLTLGAAERVAPDGDVIALDLSVGALEELRAHTAASNVSYLVGQADVLPLPDASVDAVVSCAALIDVEEAAREFARVLRSGGRVSLCELGERAPALNEASDPMLNFDEQAFSAAGLVEVAVELGAQHVFLTARKP